MRRRVLVVTGIASLGFAALASWHVRRLGRGSPSADSQRSVAIVPGAHVHVDGRLSASLTARLEIARQLFEAGRVRQILVSGQRDADGHYDEARDMRRFLLDRHIPAQAILSDAAGDRTLLTMRNARDRFAVRDAFVCTQAFHLPRSLFLARAAGIEADGALAEGVGGPWQEWREVAAQVRAVVDVYVLRQL